MITRRLRKGFDAYGVKLEIGQTVVVSFGHIYKAVIEDIKIKDRYCALTVRAINYSGNLVDYTSTIKDGTTAIVVKEAE